MIRNSSLLPNVGPARLEIARRGLPPVTRKVDEVLRRFEAAKQHKTLFVPTLMEIFDYFMPNRGVMGGGEMPPSNSWAGQRKTDMMLDSTPLSALRDLISTLHTTLVPAFRRWLILEAGQLVAPEYRQQVEEALEEQTDILFDYIDQSNFHTAMDEELYDFAAGTGTLRVQPGTLEQPIDFTAVSIASVVPEEGPHGRVETVFLERNVQGRNVMRMWPTARLGSQLTQLVEKEPDREIEIKEAEIYDPDTVTWEYHVIAKAEKERIVEARSELPSLYVHRWAKLPNENMGRGPCHDALPSARTLNAIKEYTLKGAKLALFPPIISGQFGLINPRTFGSHPNAVNMAEDVTQVVAMERRARLDFSSILVEDERAQIRAALFQNKLSPADPNNKVLSPTEWLLAQKNTMEAIGGTFPRFYGEFLFPVIRRATQILTSFGIMAPIRVDGRDVKARFVGPLAALQDQDDVIAFERYLQVVSNLGPEVTFLGTKVEDVPEWVADKVGMPVSLVRSREDRSQIQQAIGAMIAKQRAAATGVSSPPAPGVAASPDVSPSPAS